MPAMLVYEETAGLVLGVDAAFDEYPLVALEAEIVAPGRPVEVSDPRSLPSASGSAVKP
ncbi:hypothetical protein JCM31271_30900 [Halorubrum trueperi]